MKNVFIILLVLLSAISLFALGTKETGLTNDMREYTDSLGRKVMIPKEINRIAPSGNVAQVQLYTIANDLMVGNATFYNDNAKRYLQESNINLPLLGAFYGKKANLNKEALIAADPQIVIDIGEIKGSKDEMIKDLDELQAQLNIPIVFIESYLEDTASSYRDLGIILNREVEAEALAKFAEDAIATAKELKAKIEKPVKVYYSTAIDGLDAIGKENFHAEVLELVGAENVVPKSKSKGANIISPETLLIYNPEMILLSEKDAYDSFKQDSIYANLDAVQTNNIKLLPIAPYPWIDTPPSVNRLIGIYYLGNLLYPELYSDIDLNTKIKEFFFLFYKYDLTDVEIEELIDR